VAGSQSQDPKHYNLIKNEEKKMKQLLQYYYDNPLQGVTALAVTGLSLVEGGLNYSKGDKYQAEYYDCVARNQTSAAGKGRYLTFTPEGQNYVGDNCGKVCTELCYAADNAYAIVALSMIGLVGVLATPYLPDLPKVKKVLHKKAVQLGVLKPNREHKTLLSPADNSGYGATGVVATTRETTTHQSPKDLETGNNSTPYSGLN
jgi:hypothetical protein